MKKMRLAVLLLPLMFIVIASLSSVHAVAASYLIVPLRPLSNRNVFYGGSVLDVKFQLLDPQGALVTDATATLWVDGSPAVGRGQFNTGNSFTIQGQTYVFKLDTSPLSAGFGSPLHTLTIMASVGGTEVATASFNIALH